MNIYRNPKPYGESERNYEPRSDFKTERFITQDESELVPQHPHSYRPAQQYMIESHRDQKSEICLSESNMSPYHPQYEQNKFNTEQQKDQLLDDIVGNNQSLLSIYDIVLKIHEFQIQKIHHPMFRSM